MHKKAFLACMLGVTMLLTGCTLIEKDKAVDRATEVVRVSNSAGGEDIVYTKGEVLDEVNYQLNYMSYLYSMLGYSYDPTDPTIIAQTKDDVMDMLVEDAVEMALDILNGNALQEGTMLFMNIDPNLTVESAVGFPAGLRFAVKYRYYPLGRYLHEQPGKALLRALNVLKEETEAVSRQGTEQLLEANAEIRQLRKQLAEQQQHLADLQNSRAAYEASLENVLASSSWKLTAPLRKLLGLFHRH